MNWKAKVWITVYFINIALSLTFLAVRADWTVLVNVLQLYIFTIVLSAAIFNKDRLENNSTDASEAEIAFKTTPLTFEEQTLYEIFHSKDTTISPTDRYGYTLYFLNNRSLNKVDFSKKPFETIQKYIEEAFNAATNNNSFENIKDLFDEISK